MASLRSDLPGSGSPSADQARVPTGSAQQAGGEGDHRPSIFSKRHHAFQILGITTFLALELLIFARVFTAPLEGTGWLVLLGALLAGYVSGDFASGFVHWLFDRYGTIHTPVVGKPFVLPFRIHHVDQDDITLHGFVDTNGNNCLATTPFLIGVVFLPAPAGAGLNLALQAFFAALCFGVFATNQFHKWSHLSHPHPVVRWLQDHHLILGRAHHAIHHTPPYDRYYCIMAGWLNSPLQALRFWERLEALVFAATGVRAGIEDAAMVKAAEDHFAAKAAQVRPH